MKALVVDVLFTNEPNATAARMAEMAALLHVLPQYVDTTMRRLRTQIKAAGVNAGGTPQVHCRLYVHTVRSRAGERVYMPRICRSSSVQVLPLDTALLSRFGEARCCTFGLSSSAVRCPPENGGGGSDSDEAPPPLAGQQAAGSQPPTKVVPLLARHALEACGRACFSGNCIVPARAGRYTCASHRVLESPAHEAHRTQHAERLYAMMVSAELCPHAHHASSMHLLHAHCIGTRGAAAMYRASAMFDPNPKPSHIPVQAGPPFLRLFPSIDTLNQQYAGVLIPTSPVEAAADPMLTCMLALQAEVAEAEDELLVGQWRVVSARVLVPLVRAWLAEQQSSPSATLLALRSREVLALLERRELAPIYESAKGRILELASGMPQMEAARQLGALQRFSAAVAQQRCEEAAASLVGLEAACGVLQLRALVKELNPANNTHCVGRNGRAACVSAIAALVGAALTPGDVNAALLALGSVGHALPFLREADLTAVRVALLEPACVQQQ